MPGRSSIPSFSNPLQRQKHFHRPRFRREDEFVLILPAQVLKGNALSLIADFLFGFHVLNF